MLTASFVILYLQYVFSQHLNNVIKITLTNGHSYYCLCKKGNFNVGYVECLLSFIMFQMLPDLRSTTSSARAVLGSEPPVCPSDCNRYTGTLDVLYKVIRQVSKHIYMSVWQNLFHNPSFKIFLMLSSWPLAMSLYFLK